MSREEKREGGLYYTIVQGSFRVKVDKDNPDAVRRDWTSADGKKSGTKYERVINALFGKIETIEFKEGDFGMQMMVKLDKNEDGDTPIIALSTASREGEDLMKKLPRVDLEREVRLRPFSFEGDGGEEVKGMEVMQADDAGNFTVKITNHFRGKIEKEVKGKMTEVWDNINGYPNPDWDADYTKDEWKIYFMQARQFLIKNTQERIIPKLGLSNTGTKKPKVLTNGEVDPDEIPF